MEQLRSILDTLPLEMTYFQNTLADYLWALLVFVGVSVLFALIQWGVLRRLEILAKKTETDIDDAVIDVVKSVRPEFYYFLAFFIAIQSLTLNDFVLKLINAVLIIWIVYQAVIAINTVVNYILKRRMKSAEDRDTRVAYDFLTKLIKGAVWAIAILMVLSNLGVNITSLVAGLGIGGIAIAFALQNILADLFSSLAIYFDKPFAVGDFIVVGEHVGTVEKIGIKSTRIRALQGEEIVISNQELTSTRIQNFRKLKERRIAFKFGVLYETSVDLIEEVPKMVTEIFDKIETGRLDRVHFFSFGDSSLDFEVVYYVQSNDYNQYMDTQQAINVAMMKAFAKKGIEFAYPTRTVYVKK